MISHNREKQIKKEVTRIEQSTLSASEYIKRYGASFSLAQFYRYRKILSRGDLSALKDKRRNGNHRKLGQNEMVFLRGFVKNRAFVETKEAQQAIADEFGIQVHRSTMNNILKKLGVIRTKAPTIEVVKKDKISCAGFELIAALAIHFGWTTHTAQCLMEVITSQREQVEPNESVDKNGRNASGQFTGQYNQRSSVRQMRFASIEIKRLNKTLERMKIFSTSRKNIERKVMAILALPLVTLNGEIRHVNAAFGNTLHFFCGYNYKQATLDMFLRELKYLGVSQQLLVGQVKFWHSIWKTSESDLELPFLCFYIDGNTKPVWSSKRVKQNKVTMLGRVMGCLEQVFVHDCFGHPIYFETYSGHGPLGVYTLSMMEKVEYYLKEIGIATQMSRVLVMDGAHNSVETLRAFASQEPYHYITTLDNNQWSERKIRTVFCSERYRWGAATLYDSEIELEDSKEKGYLVVVRAIRIEWDHGKRTILLTSLSTKTVGPSLVAKGYFDRWPQQELVFRGMKGFASFHRVAGYGKQKLEDTKVRETQKELEKKLQVLHEILEEPLMEITQKTTTLTALIEKERVLRNKSRIKNGSRICTKLDAETLKKSTREIEKVHRQIKTIEKQYEKEFKKLHRYEAKWMRLQGKEVVYKIDVELDQIMTYFRVSLSNICAYFLTEFLEIGATSFSTLMQSILLLDGEIEETGQQRKVILKRNLKEPVIMNQLETALVKLNALSFRTLSGKYYQFELS